MADGDEASQTPADGARTRLTADGDRCLFNASACSSVSWIIVPLPGHFCPRQLYCQMLADHVASSAQTPQYSRLQQLADHAFRLPRVQHEPYLGADRKRFSHLAQTWFSQHYLRFYCVYNVHFGDSRQRPTSAVVCDAHPVVRGQNCPCCSAATSTQ
jgi:hypothetical protein